ncbi:MAG: acyl-ACP--UDP-N-acetylglucosamine O-acyltransferase [Hyphomicrobiales bacterium]
MTKIHPSSVIADTVTLGEGVEIGPFCHLSGNVSIGDGSHLHSHVAVSGNTDIGPGAQFYPFSSVGLAPQDLKYANEETKLIIGKNCIVREGVTINPGTVTGTGETRIGDNCAFLANSHVAHDCVVGSNVILSNGVLLAGHVTLGDHVIMGGGSAVHQFTRIGDYAFVGGLAGVENDVIPFGMALGNRAYLGGVNLVGMKRHQFERESIHAVRQLYKVAFGNQEGTLGARVAEIANELKKDPQVSRVLDFINAASDRAFCMPRLTRD